jgi:hypothetical protein
LYGTGVCCGRRKSFGARCCGVWLLWLSLLPDVLRFVDSLALASLCKPPSASPHLHNTITRHFYTLYIGCLAWHRRVEQASVFQQISLMSCHDSLRLHSIMVQSLTYVAARVDSTSPQDGLLGAGPHGRYLTSLSCRTHIIA